VRLAPDVALLRVELAQVEIEANDEASIRDALVQLKSSVITENAIRYRRLPRHRLRPGTATSATARSFWRSRRWPPGTRLWPVSSTAAAQASAGGLPGPMRAEDIQLEEHASNEVAAPPGSSPIIKEIHMTSVADPIENARTPRYPVSAAARRSTGAHRHEHDYVIVPWSPTPPGDNRPGARLSRTSPLGVAYCPERRSRA